MFEQNPKKKSLTKIFEQHPTCLNKCLPSHPKCLNKSLASIRKFEHKTPGRLNRVSGHKSGFMDWGGGLFLGVCGRGKGNAQNIFDGLWG